MLWSLRDRAGFRRTGDPQTDDFEDAEILGRYGKTPADLMAFTGA